MNLTTLRKDIEEGIKQGIVYVEKGVALVREKAEELTDEGKKKYRIFELKTKMQKSVVELGARVYALSADESIQPVHKDVQKLIARIQKAECVLAKLEGKTAAPAVKTPSKKTSATAVAKKPAAKKASFKKAAAKK